MTRNIKTECRREEGKEFSEASREIKIYDETVIVLRSQFRLMTVLFINSNSWANEKKINHFTLVAPFEASTNRSEIMNVKIYNVHKSPTDSPRQFAYIGVLCFRSDLTTPSRFSHKHRPNGLIQKNMKNCCRRELKVCECKKWESNELKLILAEKNASTEDGIMSKFIHAADKFHDIYELEFK